MDNITTDQSVVTITMPEPENAGSQPSVDLSNPMQKGGEVVNTVVNPVLPVVNEQTSTLVSTVEAKIEEVKPKHAGGRPCKYCENADAIQKDAEEYLKECKANKNAIPFLEELADRLEVDSDTIDNWATKKNTNNELEHPEFFRTYKSIRNRQKLQLLKRTLGRYNPTGAIFQLKANHGLMESEKKILAGDTNEPLEIIITEDRAKINE